MADLSSSTPLTPGTTDGGFNSDGLLATLFTELNAVANDLKKHEARLHREANLPPGELAILQLLAQQPRTVPQLARLRGSSRQNVQIMVNRLKRQSWVQAVPNPAHKRCPLIQITTEGKSVLGAACSRQQQQRTLWQTGFPEAQAVLALETVRQLRDVLRGAGKCLRAETIDARSCTKEKTPTLKEPGRAATAAPQGGVDDAAEQGLPVNLL